MRGYVLAIGGIGLDEPQSEALIDNIVARTGRRHPNVLFLPTAHHDNPEELPDVCAAFRPHGCAVDMLLLSDPLLPPERVRSAIAAADIVYVGGGNLKFLMDAWNRSGATGLLRGAYERGAVLCGSSSGAMCWFDTGYDDCGENGAFMFVPCVGLVRGCMCPHYQSVNWQTFREAVRALPCSGVACTNNGVYCVGPDGIPAALRLLPEAKVFTLDIENGHAETEL